MSNTRKPKTNAAKIDIAKPEPMKSAPVKPAAIKAAAPAPAPVKTAPMQVAPALTPVAPILSPKPGPAPSAPPQRAAAQAPAPRPVVPDPKPVTAISVTPKAGHVSLELVKPGAKHVFVAGSFNEWKPDKTPLVQIGNGRWVGDLTVNPGRHEYLFVVDGQWLPDPNAKESVQNPFGGRNSILTVST